MNETVVLCSEARQRETYCLQRGWTSKQQEIKVGEEKSGKLEGLYRI